MDIGKAINNLLENLRSLAWVADLWTVEKEPTAGVVLSLLPDGYEVRRNMGGIKGRVYQFTLRADFNGGEAETVNICKRLAEVDTAVEEDPRLGSQCQTVYMGESWQKVEHSPGSARFENTVFIETR